MKKQFVYGFIAAVILMVAILKIAPKTEAQSNRLQLHGQVGNDGYNTEGRVQVWCDAGTGTLAFTFSSHTGAAMALLANGCPKAK